MPQLIEELLSPSQLRVARREMERVRRHPPYAYPWEELVRDLRGRGGETMRLVVYGSLLSLESASHTLSHPGAREPVLCLGGRRLFQYRIPRDNTRYGPPPIARENAALNVVATGRLEDIFNGILLSIDLAEIDALRGREVGYDLSPVLCLRWNDLGAPPFISHTLSCPDDPDRGDGRLDATLLPHRRYYQVCREGAGSLGDRFLDLWLETTYLADGITPVGDWEKHGFTGS